MRLVTRFTEMIGTAWPIVQAGMSWASSSPALPLAVSNAGGLGVLAAGPMRHADLQAAIRTMNDGTDRPWAVNVPLYRKEIEPVLDILEAERVPVIVASQGGPKKHLARFHDTGARWLHVTAFVEHAVKAAGAGVDGIVVVGTEAGGHPPANEVSTLVTVRRVLQEVDCPVIAGGGVADGYGIAALLALGADAVQLGTRFLMTEEASVHAAYKQSVLDAEIDGTDLIGRGGLPVRGIRNDFAARVAEAERSRLADRDPEAWKLLLTSATLKDAALDGNIAGGKVEAGQSAGLIHDILPARVVFDRLVAEMQQAIGRIAPLAHQDQDLRKASNE